MPSKRRNLLAAGNAGDAPVYVEDVFSTYLYTGTGAAQTITNGVDLDGEGGLVWMKNRTRASTNHALQDTTRGGGNYLFSNTSAAETTYTDNIVFNTDGFQVSGGGYIENFTGDDYASWTFRKAEGFFDIVTWTGNASASQNVSHALGYVPGVIMAKGTSGATNWPVYHKDMNGGVTPEEYYLILDGTSAQSNGSDNWGDTAPTDAVFTVGGNNNVDGYEYVAYIFAHDAQVFGAGGDESIIKCGSYTETAGTVEVDLEWEPQYIWRKSVTATGSWEVVDTMRGLTVGGNDARLVFQSSAAENSGQAFGDITATGFTHPPTYGNGVKVIYMAIRRPMKVPEAGTEVFIPVERTGTSAEATITAGFTPDLVFACQA
jgi:hypothetical protein